MALISRHASSCALRAEPPLPEFEAYSQWILRRRYCRRLPATVCPPSPLLSPSPQPALSLIAEMDPQLLTISVLRLCERIVNGSWHRLSKPIPRKRCRVIWTHNVTIFIILNQN